MEANQIAQYDLYLWSYSECKL